MLYKRIVSIAAALCLSAAGLLPCCAHAGYSTDALDTAIKGYSRKCAVTIETVDGNLLYSYQPERIFSGASLIKLAYASYVCEQLDAGVRSLDETITYTKSWFHDGSGIIIEGEYGTEYTIRDLLDYMLRYSDNVAYDMLVYLFGVDGFNAMLEEWGTTVRIGEKYPRFPGLSADFAKTAMQRMQRRCHDGECWELCWTSLLSSTDIIVRDYFPEETVLAVKYGEVTKVHHEVCYVGGETPYFLTIMTETAPDDPDEAFFESIVNETMQLMADYSATEPMPGDINYSGTVNASDAARVLIAAAEQGAGGSLGLSQRQQSASDVSRDGVVNASDAALILQYAAAAGSGEALSPEDFFGAVQDE